MCKVTCLKNNILKSITKFESSFQEISSKSSLRLSLRLSFGSALQSSFQEISSKSSLREMCGIFIYVGKRYTLENLLDHFNRIKYRGPDESRLRIVKYPLNDKDVFVIFGFHRLAIMDTTEAGIQPMTKHNATIVTNGEIYNWRELERSEGFHLDSRCDTEIMLDMYNKYGIEMINKLCGYFAFALFDHKTNNLYVARDHFGVRSLYYGVDDQGELFIASEMKAVSQLCTTVFQFPPGYYAVVEGTATTSLHSYFSRHFSVANLNLTFEYLSYLIGDITREIRDLFLEAVRKRIPADREIGCLLSGGLDSSLVATLVRLFLKRPVKTFSIGFPGSTDLRYAKIASGYIKSDHTEFLKTKEQFLEAIDPVIYVIESYDVTTVRASVGNWLVCKDISETSDCKVIFNGDGSDELFGSYKYMEAAPSLEEFYHENCKLVNNINYFDLLRSDKCISSNGLEARCPFMDSMFATYCMTINPSLKQARKDYPEKFLLRLAFKDLDVLPDEVLWRPKEAFSDGVSSQERSWHTILQEHFEKVVSDEEFKTANRFEYNTPTTKEAYYYRKVFEQYYPGRARTIPYKWMPNSKWFSGVTDPSARTLKL